MAAMNVTARTWICLYGHWTTMMKFPSEKIINMANNIHDAAIAYLQAGLCALPAKRAEKRPAVGRWKRYQKTLPTEAEMSAWMSNNPDAVCIVCGQASGNLEAIDFDGGGELFSAWKKHIPADLLKKLLIEITPSGGFHVIYRGKVLISGNLKLAQRKNGNKTETLIETRGEGGLILCAPTEGYKVIQGDISNPSLLTEAERETLLQAAWDLNELLAENSNNAPLSEHNSHNNNCVTDISNHGQMSENNSHNGHNAPLSEACSHNDQKSEPNSNNDSYATDHSDNAGRPGDDFNNRGDVRSLLEQAGWSSAFGGDNEYWRRPGKDSGWSASLKDRVFYVFSSNAAPFEP
ncbi:MAG TPA: bifunctional DNA primase/polymerase, partial [Phycisphaerae bacterium]|nr:bifunctional DNA primase/polymerase [Phycisphaerae bacterium]